LSAFLVDPSKQLCGAKAFLTQALTKNGQTVEIKIKQVDRHFYLPTRGLPTASIGFQ
jgi:hypothetical protein